MTTARRTIELFDTHTHLQDRSFDADRTAVLSRASTAGITRLVVVGEDRSSSEAGVRLARAGMGIYAAAGVHPHNARHAGKDLESWLTACCRDVRTVAVGEIGLDFHYDRSPRDVQRAVLRRQLALARAVDLPVVIHSREALDDTLSIIAEWAGAGGAERAAGGPVLGVMHCFGYDWTAAQQFLDHGFMISIPGTVTYPRAESVREVARRTPWDRLVLETDAPVLAPQQHRGRRNEPAYLAETARAVAELRSVSVEDLAAQTAENARRLFRLTERAERDQTAAGVSA